MKVSVSGLSFDLTTEGMPSNAAATVEILSEKQDSLLFTFDISGEFVWKELVFQDADMKLWFNLGLQKSSSTTRIIIPIKYTNVNYLGLSNIVNTILSKYLSTSPYLLFKDGMRLYLNFDTFSGIKYIAGEGLLLLGTNNPKIDKNNTKFLN